MDHSTHDQLSSFFGSEPPEHRGSADSSQQNVYSSSMIMPSFHSNVNAGNMNMFSSDALAGMMGMQVLEGGQGQAGMSQASGTQMVLEQQLRMAKLQQLQQLQNQIFQQQLELINGQGGLSASGAPMEPPRDSQSYHGLPTPMSSTELRPTQANPEFVSPIVLFQQPEYNGSTHREPQQGSSSHPPPDSSPAFPPHHHNTHYNPSSARSAPANLVFNMSPPVPLSSPGEMEFDISPLTSPWFSAQAGPSSFAVPNKRSASSSGDETSGKPSRKRQSPLDSRPIIPLPRKMSMSRGTKSASSTPLLTGTRRRGGSIVTDIAGDTPSPVDLSMPPPAPPMQNASTASSAATTSSVPPNLMPATPGSIMNIANMGLNHGLAPPPHSQQSKEVKQKTTKTRSSSKSVSKDARNDAAAAVRQSPSLKPILPAGGSSSLTITSSTPSVQSTIPGRKTSHKAAEQARRDQIKAAYNDLRMLLPPIPMPSGDALGSETVLPGSMPPRGPPKGDGPNKAVSKLQLLLCGNDYIRKLKGRVERRDDEIAKLREEVCRLRLVAGDAAEGGEELDLERDLDAAEPAAMRMGSVPGDGDEADEEEE